MLSPLHTRGGLSYGLWQQLRWSLEAVSGAAVSLLAEHPWNPVLGQPWLCHVALQQICHRILLGITPRTTHEESFQMSLYWVWFRPPRAVLGYGVSSSLTPNICTSLPAMPQSMQDILCFTLWLVQSIPCLFPDDWAEQSTHLDTNLVTNWVNLGSDCFHQTLSTFK